MFNTFKHAASSLAALALMAAPHAVAQDANFDELGPEMETAGQPDQDEERGGGPTEPVLDDEDEGFAEERPNAVYDEAPPAYAPAPDEDEAMEPADEASAPDAALADDDAASDEDDEPPTD